MERELARLMIKEHWKKACALEEKRKRIQRRLQKFPLWKRIVFYWLFEDMRYKINGYAIQRSMYVTLALGMTKTYLKLTKRMRRGLRSV